MKRTQIMSVLGLLLLAATPAMAQNDECAAYPGDAGNVCNASVDATKYFHPLVGLAISGGNPLIGSGRALGGLGHFAIGVRTTVMEAQLPDLSYDGSTPTVPAGEKVPVGAPTIDAAMGIFNGFGSGLLAIDALGSVVAIPTSSIEGLTVDPEASTLGDFAYKIGWGVRVGILRGSGPVPAVSVSYSQRSTPKMKYGDVPGGDDYSYAMNVDAVNWRAVAGWHLMMFDLGVGLGLDKYTGDAQIEFRDPSDASIQTINMALDNQRHTAFADLGVNFGPIKLGLEGGWQGPGDTDISTKFDDIDLEAGQYFGSLGLRIQF